SRAAPLGTARMARLGMGHLGEQQARQILSAERGGQETVGRGKRALEPSGGRYLARHGDRLMIWPRIRALFMRRQLDRDLEEELSFHLALREARHAESGVAATDAQAVARREFGNVTVFKEACRDMWTFASLENLWQDLRFAIRTFRKEPGFTAMAILSLGLGIGANSAVFTLANDLLLKAIPVHDPRHLVSLGKAEGGGVLGGLSGSLDIFPYQLYKQIENRRDVFAGVCAYGSFTIVVGVRPGGFGGPTGQANSALVSGDFFRVLGVNTVVGRGIEPSDAD